MPWMVMSIRRRFFIVYSFILIPVFWVIVISCGGILFIVKNKTQYLDANKLDSFFAKLEGEHLALASQVKALLTDKKNIKFDEITDKRKSRLGAFLYGDKRKKFEDFMPYLKQLLSRIESYHLDIHSSISEIIKIIKPVTVDPDLSGFIIEKKMELVHFFFKLNEFLVKKKFEVDITADDHLCSLGTWLYSEKVNREFGTNNKLSEIIKALKNSHKKLHSSVVEIQQLYKNNHTGKSFMIFEDLNGLHKDRIKAQKCLTKERDVVNVLFKTKFTPYFKESLMHLDKLQNETKHILDCTMAANKIYETKILPAVISSQIIFCKLREEIRKHVMSDKKMLYQLKAAKQYVSFVRIILVAAICIIISFFISKSIALILLIRSGKINKGVKKN